MWKRQAGHADRCTISQHCLPSFHFLAGSGVVVGKEHDEWAGNY